MITIHQTIFPKIKEGVHQGLSYLVEKYGFKFYDDIGQVKAFQHFSYDEIEVVNKNDLYLYVYWNIYEGLNFEVRTMSSDEYDFQYLGNLYSSYIPVSDNDMLKVRNKKRREWLSQFRDFSLMEEYEKTNLVKYFEYYVTTELKIVEKYYPEIFERGILPD